MSKIDDIKKITPNMVYFHGGGEFLAMPVDADILSMPFIQEGEYTVYFTSLTEAERAEVLSLLSAPTLQEQVDALKLIVATLMEL